MERDIELDLQSRHNLETSKEQILDKTLDQPTSIQDIEAPITSNGTPRSKFRMFAILTALFVRWPSCLMLLRGCTKS